MVSEHRERGTQTEERLEEDSEQGGEVVKGGLVVLVKNKGEKEEQEGVVVVKRRRSDLSRKITLSKSFSRLLSFRRVKK